MPIRVFVTLFVLLGGSLGLAEEPRPANRAENREIEDVTVLPPFQATSTRLEDFGFRAWGMLTIGGTSNVIVTDVFPNTPASKAGLRPGECILKIDGKSMSFFSKMSKLHKLQELKWAQLEAGTKSVTYSLEVRAPGSANSRTVVMVIPSPAPHWGSEKWTTPQGRTPALVKEAGPLAAVAREVLENGIWSALQDESFFGAPSVFKDPILGYEWSIMQASDSHRIWTTQQRGKTEIILEHRSPQTGWSLFLTSPSGAMDKAHCVAPKTEGKRPEPSGEEARAQFQAEIDFWLKKVGRVTGRWPFEALSGNTEIITGSSRASREAPSFGIQLTEDFSKLPAANAVQKELFFDAFGKVGLNTDSWAYTETSRSFDSDHVTTVRIDPSKPLPERTTLLKVDGKVPKSAFLRQWLKEDHGPLPALGELPTLSDIVDLNDVRIYADETTAVVFELPVKASNGEFSAKNVQARFRVNKTLRGFEHFSVKLREPTRVVSLATVTDTGLEARFQSFDPALAPQPVFLKMGGAMHVLFLKVSRTFEVTRTDFERVYPSNNQANLAQ